VLQNLALVLDESVAPGICFEPFAIPQFDNFADFKIAA